ncbi:F-box domain-containing protein [Aphelenchoides besseyi]|nr:F-box domain-containing protein [Aphelenchoides besseyi]
MENHNHWLLDSHPLSMGPEFSAQYMTPGSSMKRVIRRSLSTSKYAAIDYFDSLKVPDEVIGHIFKYIKVIDLIHAMQTCSRFYMIGLKSTIWKRLNLSQITIGQSALHRIMERKNEVMCLYGTTVFQDEIFYPPADIPDFTTLTFLDVSYLVVDNVKTMSNLLSRTCSLQMLNMAQFTEVDDELCHYIAQNKNLTCLNVEMCERFTINGIKEIFESCQELIELNMGWAKFHSSAFEIACRKLPSSLQRLNVSGMAQSELTDKLVEVIAKRCPDLIEIDLSDCSEVTSAGLQTLTQLTELKKLSVCRCYGVDPFYFIHLNCLEALNLHGCVTDEGVAYLRNRLRSTLVNSSPLSMIARPTFD